MRKIVKKSAGLIHASLILALIVPILYSLGAKQPDMIGQTLYYKCLIIILPVVATDFAISRCKGLLTYLFVSAVIFAATAALGWVAAGSLRQSLMLWVYMIVLSGETVFVIIDRMTQRLHQKKDVDAARGEDPTWRPSFDSLRVPSFSVLIFFLAAYALALNLNNPPVCNAALFSAALYTVITVIYQYVSETENYLFVNKRTCNIPSKRIYGIGNGMLAIFLLLFILVMLPSLFTISNRHYRDLRESDLRFKFEYVEFVQEEEPQFAAENPMQALIDQYGEPKPAPKWLNILFYVLEAAVFTVLIAALLKTIYDTFRAFREAADENGDIVEELEESVDETVRVKKSPAKSRKLTERERVRKEYRRFIRRHRKERPARHESPTEIEQHAGIAESAECKELHKHYELARYGQES